MGNKYSQTEAAKLNYSSPLFNYMDSVVRNDPKHVFTKDELCATLNYSDRAVRKSLERMANYYPVISFSSEKGYRFVRFDDSTSVDTLKGMYDDAGHALAELQSRVESLQARMKPLIAFRVEAVQRISQLDPTWSE